MIWMSLNTLSLAASKINQNVPAAKCMPCVSLHRVTATAGNLHAILHAVHLGVKPGEWGLCCWEMPFICIIMWFLSRVHMLQGLVRVCITSGVIVQGFAVPRICIGPDQRGMPVMWFLRDLRCAKTCMSLSGSSHESFGRTLSWVTTQVYLYRVLCWATKQWIQKKHHIVQCKLWMCWSLVCCTFYRLCELEVVMLVTRAQHSAAHTTNTGNMLIREFHAASMWRADSSVQCC